MGSIYSGRAAQPANFSGSVKVLFGLAVLAVIVYLAATYGGSELGGVVGAIDQLFTQRFDALVSSMHLGKPPRGHGGSSGHGGGRKPRHLH